MGAALSLLPLMLWVLWAMLAVVFVGSVGVVLAWLSSRSPSVVCAAPGCRWLTLLTQVPRAPIANVVHVSIV